MRLPENVILLKVPIPNNPLGFLLAYVIVGQDGHTLIDTGWNAPEAYDSLRAQLAEHRLRIADVRQIVLTHTHPDHSGLASQIRAESGAKVFAHRMETRLPSYAPLTWDPSRAVITPPPLDSYGIPEEVYRHSPHSQTRSQRRGWTEIDAVLEDGETIVAGDARLEVIWTPGHTQGHICLYERRQKVLFAGDHVLPVTTPNVSLLWPEEHRHDPLGEYLASLERLRPLAVDLVLPAHDGVFADLPVRMDEIKQHHEHRLDEMLRAVDGAWITPFEIAKRITWSVGSFEGISEPHKVLAVGESLAHMQFLRKRGEVKNKQEDGLLRYRKGG